VAIEVAPAAVVVEVAAPSPLASATPGGRADRAVVDLPRPDPDWVARIARLAGIPAPAVRAYARAQLASQESCGIGWTTLAGIGWVESQHGTLGGRILGADGRPSSAIIGPALDGRGDVAAISAAPAGTSLHGDPAWEHAVGPMQFLPSTWERWGADGDGDGTVDPQDLDDAALAAAHYLCAGDGDLGGSGWAVGVRSYNHSDDYVRQVYAAAQAYAERTD